MTKPKPLEWYDIGRGLIIPSCRKCEDYITQPGMAEAIASVGIETGGINVKKLVEGYHGRKHQEEGANA